MAKIKDILGNRYGNLTVVEFYGRKESDGQALWKCVCDCGNETIVSGGKLRSGKTKSCGCLKFCHNEYDLSGDFGICYIGNEKSFLFDIDDYKKISCYNWAISSKGYAISNNGSGKIIYSHRIITNCTDGMVVDHINHNILDNRKSNLRVCTQEQNSHNRILYKNNSTGHTGVYKYKKRDCYVAKIGYKMKQITIGYYETLEEAIKARENAEKEYFGMYAYRRVK